MKTAVRFFTRSGNTKKLADAIASYLETEAKSVDVPLEEAVDILFLGCSYYAFDVDEAVKRFVSENAGKIGKIVCFGTSAGMKSVYKPMKKVADAAKVELYEKDFHCRGKFGPLWKENPNKQDEENAVSFVKDVLLQFDK